MLAYCSWGYPAQKQRKCKLISLLYILLIFSVSVPRHQCRFCVINFHAPICYITHSCSVILEQPPAKAGLLHHKCLKQIINAGFIVIFKLSNSQIVFSLSPVSQTEITYLLLKRTNFQKILERNFIINRYIVIRKWSEAD